MSVIRLQVEINSAAGTGCKITAKFTLPRLSIENQLLWVKRKIALIGKSEPVKIEQALLSLRNSYPILYSVPKPINIQRFGENLVELMCQKLIAPLI
jgi:hypothetical protein